jgi:hypothetical protein
MLYFFSSFTAVWAEGIVRRKGKRNQSSERLEKEEV